MADETFAYTNDLAATKILTFATAGRLLAEFGQNIVPNQISSMTMGGVRLTYDRGDPQTQWRFGAVVPYSSLTETDLADVQEFVGTTYINYAENAFAWTESDGVTTHTVYMINQFSWSMIGGSFVKISFSLEELNT